VIFNDEMQELMISIKDLVANSKIHSEIFGSDHCSIELDIEIYFFNIVVIKPY